MTDFTNETYAAQLERLAAVYRNSPIELPHTRISLWLYTKEDVVAMVKALGGKWTKDLGNDSSYEVTFESEDFPVRVFLPKDKICKRTVTMECEPLLSPADEAELLSGEAA